MRRNLNGIWYANSIRMQRTSFKGTFIIVEGDSDRNIYGCFFNTSLARLIPSDGKPNALKAISILERDNFEGVVCLVDADFDRILQTLSSSPNIIYKELHDL